MTLHIFFKERVVPETFSEKSQVLDWPFQANLSRKSTMILIMIMAYMKSFTLPKKGVDV